jgi:predicted PurR-regulated permease PerM
MQRGSGEDGSVGAGDAVGSAVVPADAASSPAPEPMPPWLKPAIRNSAQALFVVLVLATLSVLLLLYLTRRLSSFLSIIFMSLFVSFAIEPAVTWFAARGWRRGYATALMFGIILLTVVGLVALIAPAIVQGFQQVVEFAPRWVNTIVRWLGRIGIDVSGDKLVQALQGHAQDVASYSADLLGNLFGLGASVLGAVFRWATIALFTFYFVAEGPKVRRVVCSALPPARQEHMLFVLNQAIEKTGGYFYSRLLLAFVNGTGMYLTLRVFNVPFAAPLAIFEGVVAAFIPIVGTYLAGIPPILVALLTSRAAGIAALAYILIYQQIENYFLSPRLTAKTMSLHPAVAFAAALIGGALGGILAAFLALPVAGVIQATVQEYRVKYEVVDSDLTNEPPPKPDKPPRSLSDRLRRSKDDESEGGEDAATD